MANEQRHTATGKMSPRQRQYEIDRITAQYVEERRAGRSPRVEDYTQRHPEYAREIRLFVADYLLIGERLPEPDLVPTAPLSSAALAALAQIELESAPVVPIAGLVARGIEQGYEPPRLAAAVGISMDVLAKLDAKAIIADTIPFTLVERLAEKLQAVPEAVAAFLVGTAPAQAPAHYYAEQAPEQRQESFLDAIQASDALDENAKWEWADIVARDVPPA
ncbi:MAG TPA: hypothetical protein VKT52_11710 [Ktedonobacterales bacterium]|nr:hypothetical protein [Ktedonobacterales bacterium]